MSGDREEGDGEFLARAAAAGTKILDWSAKDRDRLSRLVEGPESKDAVRSAVNARRRPMTGGEQAAGAARAFATSATLGAYPYAEAFMRGPETIGGELPSYRERLHDLSRKQARFRNENPITNVASEIAGSLPLMALPIKVPGVGRLPAAARPAATGAIVGGGTSGITSFNDAEGGIGDRLGAAAQGTVMGAAAGTLVGPTVAQIAPWAARKTMIKSRNTQRGEALDRLNEVLRQGGMKPDDIAMIMGDEHARGIPSFLMDTDPGFARLAEGAVTKGGANPDILARNLLNRNKGQRERVADQVEEHLIPGGLGLYETEQRILAQLKSPEMRRAYRAAEEAGQTLSSPELNDILDKLNRAGRLPEALHAAQEMGIYKGTVEGSVDDAVKRVTRDIENLGDNPSAGLSTRTLHLVKLALNTLLTREQFGSQLTGQKNPLGGDLQDIVSDLNAEMKRLNPLYADAQAKYAEPAQALTALRVAQSTATTVDSARLAGEFPKLSPAAQDMFRIGQAENLRQKPLSASTSQNSAEQIVGTPNISRNIDTTTDPKAAALLKANLRKESDMFTTGSRIAAGSRTANKTEAAKAYDDGPGIAETAVNEAAQAVDNPVRTAIRWVSKVPARSQPRLRAEEAAAILGADSPDEVDFAIQLMKQRGVDVETQKKVLEKLGARAAIPAGAATADEPEARFADGGRAQRSDALQARLDRLQRMAKRRGAV